MFVPFIYCSEENKKTRPKVVLTKQKGVALTIYLYIYAVQYIEATDPLSLVQTFCLAKKGRSKDGEKNTTTMYDVVRFAHAVATVELAVASGVRNLSALARAAKALLVRVASRRVAGRSAAVACSCFRIPPYWRGEGSASW